MTDRLYTVADLCEYLQVSRSTVNRLVSDGKIPVVKIGGSIRFSPAAVERFVRCAETKLAPPPPRKTVRIGGKVAPAEPFRYVPGMKVV